MATTDNNSKIRVEDIPLIDPDAGVSPQSDEFERMFKPHDHAAQGANASRDAAALKAIPLIAKWFLDNLAHSEEVALRLAAQAFANKLARGVSLEEILFVYDDELEQAGAAAGTAPPLFSSEVVAAAWAKARAEAPHWATKQELARKRVIDDIPVLPDEELDCALTTAKPAAATPKKPESVLAGLCIATEAPIFSPLAVKALHEAAIERGDYNDRTPDYFAKLLKRGPARFVTRPASAKVLEPLFYECPNFVEPLTDLRRQLSISFAGNGRFRVLPLMLLGDAGVGKTYFAKRLATVLGTEFKFISMNTTGAGFLLTGNSSQWNRAQPGAVSTALVDGTCANPLMLVDELDKATGSVQSDPISALYQLLEPETSSHFVDEYASVEFDASNVVWVFTANDAQKLPDPLLSRMAVYNIPAPDKEQSFGIAGRLYASARAELGLDKFAASLDDAVCAKVGALSPRLMKRALLDAFGKAVEAGRDALVVDDFAAGRSVKRGMGF